MLDGLRPDTCVIVVDNIRWDRDGVMAMEFDLFEYGCDGDNRVLLAKQRIEAWAGQVGVSRSQLEWIEHTANEGLKARIHCTCR